MTEEASTTTELWNIVQTSNRNNAKNSIGGRLSVLDAVGTRYVFEQVLEGK